MSIRVTAKRGKTKRSFILEKEPFPEVGDVLTLPDKTDWDVVAVKKCKALLYVDFPKATAKKVFP